MSDTNEDFGVFTEPDYAICRRFPGADPSAIREATIAALAAEGFGVLTEIDVRGALKKKLDVDTQPYVILGACAPPLAHKALAREPGIGVLLPCNVVVTQESGGDVVVAAVDPEKLFELVKRSDVKPLAKDVKERLQRVVAAIAA